MLLDLFLGLHMDTLTSNREFGFQLGAGISENSSIGVQFSTASTDNKLDSKSYDVKYEMQSVFYRYQFFNGWFVNLNAIKREAHEKIGIIMEAPTAGDVIYTFEDQMDIDAESYLIGTAIGYELVSDERFFLNITAASYAIPVAKRSWSTLELLESSRTFEFQNVHDAAERFAEKLAEKEEFGFLKVSAGIKF